MFIVVSNRLPLSRGVNGSLIASSGGLASAFASVRDGGLDFIWVGSWESVDAETDARVRQELGDKFCPVFIDKQMYKLYYDTFANDVMWPILHFEESKSLESAEIGKAWDAYKFVNEKFAQVIAGVVAPTGAAPNACDIMVNDCECPQRTK
jgi:trehalose 6-phosphate synthase